MIDQIVENNLINSLITNFPRSEHQINKVHETDAELLTLGNRSVLAITTDSIAEEIETGLYKDPYLTGWM